MGRSFAEFRLNNGLRYVHILNPVSLLRNTGFVVNLSDRFRKRTVAFCIAY